MPFLLSSFNFPPQCGMVYLYLCIDHWSLSWWLCYYLSSTYIMDTRHPSTESLSFSKTKTKKNADAVRTVLEVLQKFAPKFYHFRWTTSPTVCTSLMCPCRVKINYEEEEHWLCHTDWSICLFFFALLYLNLLFYLCLCKIKIKIRKFWFWFFQLGKIRISLTTSPHCWCFSFHFVAYHIIMIDKIVHSFPDSNHGLLISTQYPRGISLTVSNIHMSTFKFMYDLYLSQLICSHSSSTKL